MPRQLILLVLLLTVMAVCYLSMVRMLDVKLGTQLAAALILLEWILTLAIDRLVR